MSEPEIPPNVLDTINKTVGYVVKNGPAFEERLRLNANEKFTFLNPTDEYHQYYASRLRQQRDEATGGTPATESNLGGLSEAAANAADVVDAASVAKPAAFKYIADIPPISSLDLDVIKLTALFVAKNGPGYAEQLRKHKKEPQFEFLDTSHSLNKLFHVFVKQYEHVIGDETAPRKDILHASYERARFEKHSRASVQKRKRLAHERQVEYASIDWQDYSIVGRVKFDEVDEVKELPVPLKRDELVFRSLESKRQEVKMEVASAPSQSTTVEADKGKVTTTAATIGSASGGSTTAAPKGMKIKAAGSSRLKKSTSTESTIKCPLTGKQIPESKFDSHLKVLLRDPRYKEQQENFMKKNFTYSSNLTTDQVYDNIKRMALKRKNEELPESKKPKTIGPSST